jgi:tRNA nucleotidyltransferase (CCA-adding enzyme)
VKAYVVGGAVRDELLGLPVADRDWVVVGATFEEMVAQGFKPVGRDFPVFLHPQTHEEYALARTERKSGRGYKGFTVYAAPEVTLEDDLRRRDLTINAMAKSVDGALIDPFGGKRDLEQGVLRHVSESFAEDPVRILRVARFAARLAFRVADETAALMAEIVRSGEADFLVPERVWQEFSRGLAEAHPERMFEVLERCGLLAKFLPELRPHPETLTRAARAQARVAVRFATLAWPLEEAEVRAVTGRLRAPNEVRELALLAARNRPALREAHAAGPEALLELLKRSDAFRRRERFLDLLEVARLAEPGPQMQRGAERLERALDAAAAVDAGALAASASSAAEIPARIDEARTRAIAGAL